MATIVTNTYHCEWHYVTDNHYDSLCRRGRYEWLSDHIVDAEDDIITTAIYVYITEYDFLGGDDQQIRLSVFWDEQEKVYTVVTADQATGDMGQYLCDVIVEVRSATMRF